MTVESIVSTLEKGGYKFDILGDQIIVILPDNVLDTQDELIDEIRQNKPAFLSHLRYRGFEEVAAADGEAYTVEFEGQDALQRWGAAYRSGLIALTGKVLTNRRTGVFRISFRCAMPLEWLEEAMAVACGCEN